MRKAYRIVLSMDIAYIHIAYNIAYIVLFYMLCTVSVGCNSKLLLICELRFKG